jgi:hypothetical protein
MKEEMENYKIKQELKIAKLLQEKTQRGPKKVP